MKKALLIFFIVGNFIQLFGGTTGKLSGLVKDKSTGEPLIGANVILKSTHLGAATNFDGEYFIVNIPIGTYTVEISMIGYQSVTIQSVNISADLTTKIDVELVPTSIELEGIKVVAQKPLVQKDLTATINIIESSDIKVMPVTNYQQVVGLQTGIVVTPIRLEQTGQYGQFNTTPDDGMHFRGGRSNETSYLINGISLKDPIWGGFNLSDLPISGLNQIVTYTGTYLAEYGEGMSAVLNMVSEPTHSKPTFSYSSYTDNLGGLNIESQSTYNNEFAYQGEVPGLGGKVHTNFALRYLTTNGRFWGYIYPNYRDTEGQDQSGTPEEVPMNYNDALSGIFSIDYNVTQNIRLILGGMGLTQKTKTYNHFFKYNPYGQPHIENNYWLGYAQLKHVLSDKYFYDLSFSRYVRNFKTSIFDDLETSLIEQHILSPELFSVSGIDYVWIKTQSNTDEIKFNFLGQITPIHQVKVGANIQLHNLDYERRNPTAQDADTTVFRMKAWEAYNKKPYNLSAYIQDKMEFNQIGMIINLGLRYDRVYPETYIMEDILHPIETSMKKSTFKDYFSPRLGVSFPVSNNLALRFSYGVYYQFPHYYLVYQGTNKEDLQNYPNYSLQEITQIGDGDINPEKTTSYETGLQVSINDNSSLNITAFYRDISDLTGLKTIYGPQSTYQIFTNDAYGTSKGLEIAFHSTVSDRLNLFANYTYSVSMASKQSTWYIPLFPQSRTFVSDWDIPHKFSFNINYVHPSNTGISLIGNLNSGFPYSPNILNPNSERGPMQSNFDVNLYKVFDYFGFQQTIFVQITNILNQRNVWWVYADTGKPGVDANDATSFDYTNDPTAYGPARHINVGITLRY